jgi:hypothetical protein
MRISFNQDIRGIYLSKKNIFNDLFNKIGIERNVDKLGIKDLENIVNGINIERLRNNPFSLTKNDLLNLFNH